MNNIIPFPRMATVGGMPALVLGPDGWHFTRCRMYGPHGWFEGVVPNAAVDRRLPAMFAADDRPCDTQPDGAA